ncbi:lytic polysaccharide monooxygenase auxiliary activity family 9 protein [Kitasatospora kifunensis]|uniref:Chitin-binding protein n=1 Tax=Kitasatospora kifunensis TaxID=58351 RepID=A0A7W7QWX9_KITKI|nr:lytic polysaccharide monooxygenase [Kitasatospora kifunensis]MBB4921272.1 chitin-binding protein [Kitasatospora kifunensis]
MRKRTALAALAAGLAVLLGTAAPAQSHGYISTPPSRAALCAADVVSDCGDIQWEPQSVEGPKGFPDQGPADGTICSGGIDRFAQLDDPRGGNWPTTPVTAGQPLTLTWTFTAEHSTTSFRYFLTKQGWDPTQPLTRDDLDLTPLLTVPMDGAQPPATLSHTIPLPSDRTGHQLLLAVWDIADTGNAFYSCTDLGF